MAHLEFGYRKMLLCRNISKEPCKGTHENFVSYWSAGIIMVILFQANLKIGKINIFFKIFQNIWAKMNFFYHLFQNKTKPFIPNLPDPVNFVPFGTMRCIQFLPMTSLIFISIFCICFFLNKAWTFLFPKIYIRFVFIHNCFNLLLSHSYIQHLKWVGKLR